MGLTVVESLAAFQSPPLSLPLFGGFLWSVSGFCCSLHVYRAREALRTCLPEQLKDSTFAIILKDDSTTKKWLSQVLQNLGLDSQLITAATTASGGGGGPGGGGVAMTTAATSQ